MGVVHLGDMNYFIGCTIISQECSKNAIKIVQNHFHLNPTAAVMLLIFCKIVAVKVRLHSRSETNSMVDQPNYN